MAPIRKPRIMPSASVSRSVEVLGARDLAQQRGRLVDRRLDAADEQHVEALELGVEAHRDGLAARARCGAARWCRRAACCAAPSAPCRRISLLVTRISAWSSGTLSTLESGTSGPISPMLAVIASSRPPSAITSPFCSTRSSRRAEALVAAPDVHDLVLGVLTAGTGAPSGRPSRRWSAGRRAATSGR